MRKIYIILLFLSIACSSFGQKLVVKAQAPEKVETGNIFQILYSVAVEHDGELRLSEHEGLDIIAGPTKSQGTVMKMVDGKVEMEVHTSYSYLFTAHESGDVEIPRLTLHIKGHDYTSAKGVIIVLAEREEWKQGETPLPPTRNEPH